MATDSIESYSHSDKERLNNPPVGLVSVETDQDLPTKSYEFDPHHAPQLEWSSKAERTSFEVPTVSLHVHERIDPLTIIEGLTKETAEMSQTPLFEALAEHESISKAIEFYQHRHSWTNRLIAGDSLIVLNSLLEKESMARTVQMVYIDPPYGIKFGSNFQPYLNRQSSPFRDSDSDLTGEPESIRAFRDTWELGIHSYLSYLRDRLLLVHEVLTQSGSVFVQIGDENVHRVALLLDEIFGAQNRLATITFATTSGSSARTIPQVADYLLWYAKDRKAVKYRQLYEKLDKRKEILAHFSSYAYVEETDGITRSLTPEERNDPDSNLPTGTRLFKSIEVTSQGASTTGRSEPFTWHGRAIPCPSNRHWSVSHEGLQELAEMGRLDFRRNQRALSWKRYENEVPGRRINNVWSSMMYPTNKRYVVQTADKVIERAILMSTDPGDLVIDPTCGSGVLPTMAEKWGRRWIACDTSRVALNIAKHRLMTAAFDYYQLARPEEGVGSGFENQTVSKVNPSTLIGISAAEEIQLYDRPFVDRTKRRITGPFTVEAVPATVVEPVDSASGGNSQPPDSTVARTGESVRQADWCNELLKNGIRGEKGQHIEFSYLDLLPNTRWIHGIGGTPSLPPPRNSADVTTVAVAFGPDHAPFEQRRVELALEEARSLVPEPSVLVFAAFQFDPEAAKDIAELKWPGKTLLKVQMNGDLLVEDLKSKKGKGEAFWLIGQPDVELQCIEPHKKQFVVTVHGFDYFNPISGEVESGGPDRIAMWMLDPDYDGRSLYPKQVFFPNGSVNGGWNSVEKSIRAVLAEDLIEEFGGNVSQPFSAGENSRAAVKIVDVRGIESLCLVPLDTRDANDSS